MHNNPESLRPHARIEHLRYTLADVDTEDIGPLFVPCHQFIEQARSSKHGELKACSEPLCSGPNARPAPCQLDRHCASAGS